jgi:hypothetical protein
LLPIDLRSRQLPERDSNHHREYCGSNDVIEGERRCGRFAYRNDPAMGDGTAKERYFALARQDYVADVVAAAAKETIVLLARKPSANALLNSHWLKPLQDQMTALRFVR